MSFYLNGYLSIDISEIQKKYTLTGYRIEHTTKMINQFCHKILFNNNYQIEDAIVQSVTLFARSLEIFQSLSEISKMGIYNTANILLRTQIETIVKLIALEKNPIEVCKDLNNSRIKAAKSLAISLTKDNFEENGQMASKLLNEIGKGPKVSGKEISFEQYCEWAQVDQSFKYNYKLLCFAVHSNLISLENHIVREDSHTIKSFNYQPDINNSQKILVESCYYQLLACESFCKIFEYDCVDQINDIGNELKMAIKFLNCHK